MIYFGHSQETFVITNRSAPLRVALVLAGSLIALCARAATLTILHTSDLHGHVDAKDELSDRDWGEGLARVATAVAAARVGGAPILLLDSGDTIQGTPMQAVAFRAEGASDPTIRAMNAVGYTAMAVGNHEFDFGMARLEASRREARFPFLSANVVREDGKPAFDPYIVRKIGGARVGILGLTTKNVPGWEPPANYAGLRFLDTVETARKFVPILRGKEKCDVVLVITHQGFEKDLASGQSDGTEIENQASAIANEVDGIDILLTGHTHNVIEPRKLGKMWISQPGRFGNTLTRFDLVLAKKGSHWEVTSISGRNLPMKDVAPDPAIVQVVAAEHSAAMRALAEPIATLASAASVRNARTADNAVLDWLHAVQEKEGQADLSFASLLPGSLPDWQPGPLLVRQVWSFYPYENSLVTVRATGRQVREALESAGRCVSGIAIQNGAPVWKRNPAVWGYNCDTLDGADYALDPTRPQGKRLLYLRRNGRDVRDDEAFTVAINSYRASGGGGYDVWRNCPHVGTPKSGIRELLLEDARRRKTIELHANENWFLSPGLPEGRFGASD
ncbi:MAG: bifunctional metallophosphatase/5'-nucleotidase [Acidobacteriota bacterium]|nr:bifunctional metallophosphatase/5'-nucleotidase [Acidobacteriota bacterium]